jgi:hypothetical protein
VDGPSGLPLASGCDAEEMMSEDGTSEFDGADGTPAGGGEGPAEQPGYGDYEGSQQAQQTPQVSAPVQPPAQPAAAKGKKRKIDLKSRLSTVRGTGAIPAATDRASDPLSFPPPPVTGGGVPAPKLPGGVAPPQISSPFAPPEPEKKVSAAQQTIKVEVGEEVVRERSKTRKKYLIFVAIAAFAALAAGFLLGMTRERSLQGHVAIEGAKGLATDIEAANKTMSAVSDALRNAGEGLSNDEFPAELEELLKTTNIDFSGANFQGRAIGGLPGEVFNRLLTYTSDVEKLNKQKDTLRNLLSAAKPQVLKYIDEKKKPKVKFAVVFTKADKKNVAELAPIKEPFDVKSDWPTTFTVLQKADKGTKDLKVNVYPGEGKMEAETPYALAVAPASVAGFTDLTLIFKLRAALSDTANLIDGVESPDPAQQTDGALKNGQKLIESLKKISQVGG